MQGLAGHNDEFTSFFRALGEPVKNFKQETYTDLHIMEITLLLYVTWIERTGLVLGPRPVSIISVETVSGGLDWCSGGGEKWGNSRYVLGKELRRFAAEVKSREGGMLC